MERGWAIPLTAPPAGSCFADILLPTVEALQQQQQEPPAAAKPPYLPPAVTAGVARILSARCCHINFLDVLYSFPEVLNPSKKLPLLIHFPQWRHSSTQWRHSSSSSETALHATCGHSRGGMHLVSQVLPHKLLGRSSQFPRGPEPLKEASSSEASRAAHHRNKGPRSGRQVPPAGSRPAGSCTCRVRGAGTSAYGEEE